MPKCKTRDDDKLEQGRQHMDFIIHVELAAGSQCSMSSADARRKLSKSFALSFHCINSFCLCVCVYLTIALSLSA